MSAKSAFPLTEMTIGGATNGCISGLCDKKSVSPAPVSYSKQGSLTHYITVMCFLISRKRQPKMEISVSKLFNQKHIYCLIGAFLKVHVCMC